MWHISDRGFRPRGKTVTPIIESGPIELGYGNMPLDELTEQALSVGVDSIILETHRNHIDHDPVKSLASSSDYLNGRIK